MDGSSPPALRSGIRRLTKEGSRHRRNLAEAGPERENTMAYSLMLHHSAADRRQADSRTPSEAHNSAAGRTEEAAGRSKRHLHRMPRTPRRRLLLAGPRSHAK